CRKRLHRHSRLSQEQKGISLSRRHPLEDAVTQRITIAAFFELIEDAFAQFHSFDESVTKFLPPLDVDNNFPLVSQSISYDGPPEVDASLVASVDTKAHAVISLGVAPNSYIGDKVFSFPAPHGQ
ncbi:hypothetical protein C0991_004405, partial [Blastosporella zonata]